MTRATAAILAAARAQRQIERTKAAEGSVEDSEPEGEHDADAPPKVVSLHGQDVNLDDLLDGTVKDITSFIEGHPVEFQLQVLARERYRADESGKSPRKTIVDAVNSNIEESNDE